MNKCFSLKKTILACRFNHPKITSRANYEYISYGEMASKNQVLLDNNHAEPMSSTFIDHNQARPFRHEYINPAFESESSLIGDLSQISTNECETLCVSDLEHTRKQNSFNSRMKGMRSRIHGNPFEKDGKMTRWLKSMLIWGHDPRKPLRKV